jgi:two-component system, response regulator PdtaR
MSARILIAEDDPIQRMELSAQLAEQGYDIIGEAADGQAAIELARTLQPDLVLMDIRLPECDGIRAAAILKQEQLAPVVLLSAFSGAWFVEGAKDAGVLNYLVKPLRESQIRPTIEFALARDRERRTQEEQIQLVQDELDARKQLERLRGTLMEKRNLDGPSSGGFWQFQ